MGSKKVTLKSSDGGVFEVEEAAALASQLIKNMIEDDCANDVIPLPNVTSNILSMVIDYCKKHFEMQKPGEDNQPLDEDLKSWDADFLKVDQPTLFDLILAANYLNIGSLLDLTCQAVADMIKGMTPEEIRKAYKSEQISPEVEEENLLAFMTPEEEEEVRRVEEEEEVRRLEEEEVRRVEEKVEEERRLLALMYF